VKEGEVLPKKIAGGVRGRYFEEGESSARTRGEKKKAG